MVKHKFEQELYSTLACGSLAPGVSEKTLRKKQKLPMQPKRGARPIINIKLSRGDNPEIDIRVMHDPGAHVPVLSKSLVGEYKVPEVLQERAKIIAGYDCAAGKGAGSAYTFACTLSFTDHYTKESFEVSPLQNDHDILMPWWWTLVHPIRYLYSRAQSDIVFHSPNYVNCSKSAMREFSNDYDESVAYFGKEQKWVGFIGSLCIDEEENVTLEIPREIPWQ